MVSDGLLRPLLGTVGRIIVRCVSHKVNCEFPPHNQFVEVAVARRLQCWMRLHRRVDRKRNRDRTNMSVMQIGRHTGGTVNLGMITLCIVAFQKLPRKKPQTLKCSTTPAFPSLNRRNTAVQVLPATGYILMNRVGAESLRPLPLMLSMKIL